MRRLLTIGCALGLSLLPVSSLQAFGIRHYHHRGVVVTPGVAYYPTTGVSTIATFSPSFVQPSTLSFAPSTISSYGCYGGMGGSSISFVPMTNLSFVPSSAFSTSSFGCYGGSGGPGPSIVQPSALNASVLVEALRLLKDVFGAKNGTPGDGTSGQVASQLAKINARLNKIDAKIDKLLGQKTITPPADKPTLPIEKTEKGPITASAVTDGQPPTALQAAAYAAHQAKVAAGNARKAYEAAVEAHSHRTARLQHEEQILAGLKKLVKSLGEKVD